MGSILLRWTAATAARTSVRSAAALSRRVTVRHGFLLSFACVCLQAAMCDLLQFGLLSAAGEPVRHLLLAAAESEGKCHSAGHQRRV